jgi:hypothetical protein
MKQAEKSLLEGVQDYAREIAEGVQQRAAGQWALWSARGQRPLWYVVKQRIRGGYGGPGGGQGGGY